VSDGNERSVSDGDRAAAISNSMASFHREFYGRGPTTVRAVIQRDVVAAVLEDIFTQAERTLIDAGEQEAVRTSRLAFQRAMEARFTEAVEQTMERKVRAFMSQVHFEPDLAVELFILE